MPTSSRHLGPALSIRDAAAPDATLRALAVALVAGGAVLVPSLVYLFRSFGARERETKPRSAT